LKESTNKELIMI